MAPGTDVDWTPDSAPVADAEPEQSADAHKQDEAADHGDGHIERSASPAKDVPASDDGAQPAAPTRDPPLPDEEAPPLPDEAPPEDDGWTYQWDEVAQAWYFHNRMTGLSQWENPRAQEATTTSYGSYDRYATSSTANPTPSSGAPGTSSPPKRRHGGYNPAIHGDYDPNADYAQETERKEEEDATAAAITGRLPTARDQDYTMAAHFNRFSGRFQQGGQDPEYHNDENKSKRQMSAFFDVDAAANSHDGRSLKAERRGKTLSKRELKAFQDKRRDKKEEKRRAWLRD